MKTNEDVEDHRNLLDWSLVEPDADVINDTQLMLPIDMRFNDGHMLSIVVYSVLMVFSAIGNLTVLVLILRRRKKTPSRINTTLMHLAIADLLVTFLMMPLEIGWAYTVSWKAGDAMCRIMAFFRTFGLYLSSFILVCISMDRYYAVLKPLHLTELDKRGKFMLTAAWMGATICSVPQMLVFHVEAHPNITWYEQCITYNVLPSYTHEVLYSVFGMMMMYTFPLVVIIFSYASILIEIYKRTRTNVGDRMRRSSLGFLGRAKIRTLKMTIIIVLVFFVCWTPYYVMMLWYWYDRTTALQVDQRIQRGLFLFACTNSCMNPIVYGVFNIRARRAGTQANFNNSQYNTCSFRQTNNTSLDVVCHVSWKKPPLPTDEHGRHHHHQQATHAHERRQRYANGGGASLLYGAETSSPPRSAFRRHHNTDGGTCETSVNAGMLVATNSIAAHVVSMHTNANTVDDDAGSASYRLHPDAAGKMRYGNQHAQQQRLLRDDSEGDTFL